MNKLLIICGPTATGKTKLALQLADKFNGELISADSRQVYTGMDIVTGKDKPKYIKVWGYDLVDPKQEFSVAHYEAFASKKIAEIQRRNKLPILIGGTGFYIKAVIDGIDTMYIPKDSQLREKLATNSREDLLNELKKTDPQKAESLNESDAKNPARLIRAIEIANYAKNHNIDKKPKQQYDSLFIGIKSTKRAAIDAIAARVDKRIEEGAVEEVKSLLANGVGWEDQSMKGLGYRQLKPFIEGEVSLDQARADWIAQELKYAKRQMTWFRKDERVNWFDPTSSRFAGLRGAGIFYREVEDYVRKWHNKGIYATKN